MEGMENDTDRNRAMFQTSDVVGVYGIQVNWMEQMEWEGWLDEGFYGECRSYDEQTVARKI